ncbi:MAG: VWA domain-containing protein [Gaiellaceae bacterium]
MRDGKYTRHRLARGDRAPDVALDATLRAAAQRARNSTGEGLVIAPQDLREKVRSRRSPLSVVVVVDNSYSVHADRMVEKTKGLARALLEDAVRDGNRVALIAFRDTVPEAAIAMPLTRSLKLARRRLDVIPLSGRTPLASAIKLAGRVLRQEILKRPDAVPLTVVITDGLPTVALRPGGDPLADLLSEARVLRRRKIGMIVADGSDQDVRLGGCGAQLADAAGGSWLAFDEIVPDARQRRS